MDFTLVQIETDEGTIANGVVYMHVGEIIQHNLKPLILGADTFATEKIWWDMYRD